MNYRELCDFTTIDSDKIIELKGTKGDVKKYACKANPDIARLLNCITEILHNRGRKDKFKRVWTSFLGIWSDKAGKYSADLNKALQDVREHVKEILDGNPRFQIGFESKDKKEEGLCGEVGQPEDRGSEPKYIEEEELARNNSFPCHITYHGNDGTKSYKIWASDILESFENYSNERTSIINEIKELENEKQNVKANSLDIDPVKCAIKILQNCLDRGALTEASALLSNIKQEITENTEIRDSKIFKVETINNSYLPLARTYQVLERIGKLEGIDNQTDNFQKAIIEADIPFSPKELDAVDKYCEGKGVDLDIAISTLKAKEEKTEQEVEDLEILENLSQKLSACDAAYKLRNAKCVSASMVSLRTPTAENIYEIAEYGDNSKHDSSEKNAVVRMANKEIKKKQSKIRLGVFISIVILLLVVAIFSAFKPSIKYAIGREIVAEVDGCEYTYRKFDDTGVEIVAAKMPEGISEYAVIPEIDGHKVVAISEGVFTDYTDFESVYIGKDIVEIGNNAFAKKDNRITIYCEAQAKPDAWAKDWANDNVVVWGWTDSQQNIEITWGNLRFAIDKGKKQAAILGLSSEAKSDEVDEIEIPSNVTYESEEYAVVRVADEAFKDAAYICKIVFEEENNAITDIGFGAFEGCSSLTDIAIPFVGATVSGEKVSEIINTVNFGYIFGADGTAKNAEYVPATLESVTIYGGIIAANAFDGCSNLQNIVLENSVTSIAQGALNGCNRLQSLTLPFVGGSNDGDIENTFFGYIFGAAEYKQNNEVVPESLKTVELTGNCDIANYAFYNCKNITTISINSGKSIGDSAFANCTSLERLFVPDEIEKFGNGVLSGCNNIKYNDWLGTKYIGSQNSKYLVLITGTNVIGKFTTNGDTRIIAENAFKDCTTIIEISITENVIMIGDSAFANCTSITNIAIPDSVTYIGSSAFLGCIGLTDVYYTGDIASWCNLSFDSSYSNPMYYAGNLYINEELLQGELKIPDRVTSIKDYAFYNCTSLTSITIPDSVRSIGNEAFYGCIGLMSITILNGVAIVEDAAFNNCSNLTDIYYMGDIEDWCIISFGDDYSNPMYYADNLYFNGEQLYGDIVLGNDVIKIPYGTFKNQREIKSVTISKSIASIGDYAFYNCANLKKVYYNGDIVDWLNISFGESDATSNPMYYADNLFINGELLQGELIIPDSVTRIRSDAFYNCTGLTSIVIPGSLTSIGSNAFSNCTGLTDVYYTGDIAGWCNISFYNISSNPMVYADNLYINGKLLQGELIIPNSVTSLGDYAFYNCKGLTSATIGNSVTRIGDSAFSNCSSLISVTIGDSVTSIGNHAFSGCSNLTSIVIPDSVTSIESYAFAFCSSLTSISMPDSVTVVGEWSFYYCTSLRDITIPNNVTSIGNCAFANCTSLTSITIPDNVTSIAPGVFSGCSNLTSITIPDGITSIREATFFGCSSLTTVIIPNSVTSIEVWAFFNCSSLTVVTFENTQDWQVSMSIDFSSYTELSSSDLADATIAATYLKDTYFNYCWRRVE